MEISNDSKKVRCSAEGGAACVRACVHAYVRAEALGACQVFLRAAPGFPLAV